MLVPGIVSKHTALVFKELFFSPHGGRSTSLESDMLRVPWEQEKRQRSQCRGMRGGREAPQTEDVLRDLKAESKFSGLKPCGSMLNYMKLHLKHNSSFKCSVVSLLLNPSENSY